MIGVTKEKTLERLIQQWLKPRQMQALISPHWANLTGKIFDRLPHASQKHNVGTCETGSKDPIMARNRSVSRPENLPAMTRIGLATSIPALQLCSFPAFRHSSIPAFQHSSIPAKLLPLGIESELKLKLKLKPKTFQSGLEQQRSPEHKIPQDWQFDPALQTDRKKILKRAPSKRIRKPPKRLYRISRK